LEYAGAAERGSKHSFAAAIVTKAELKKFLLFNPTVSILYPAEAYNVVSEEKLFCWEPAH
jgi:cation transport ATPase